MQCSIRRTVRSTFKMIRTDFLYSRDSKSKIRVSIMSLIENEDGSYTISRKTGLLDGKHTVQPDKVITKGKVKRTIEEQALLEYNSLINKQRDKGYKDHVALFPNGGITDEQLMDVDFIDKALGLDKTTSDGYRKPMLAQESVKQSETYLQRGWWVSKKLDGVRTLVHLEEVDGVEKLIFKTRGGKVYKGIAKRYEHDPEMIAIIKQYNCEIDGEFYRHGMALKDINGTCQLDEYDSDRHDNIDFYIFDLADDFRKTDDRVKILNELELENPSVKVLKHTYCIGSDDILKLHDEWVVDGYEGAMARTTSSLYQWGKRSKDLIKFKSFQDSEFKITGYEEGLRPVFDMVFTLETDTGTSFKAKPLGSFSDKEEYIKNMNNIIGKMGTVKYQYLVEDTGIPFLPVFKSVRNEQ